MFRREIRRLYRKLPLVDQPGRPGTISFSFRAMTGRAVGRKESFTQQFSGVRDEWHGFKGKFRWETA